MMLVTVIFTIFNFQYSRSVPKYSRVVVTYISILLGLNTVGQPVNADPSKWNQQIYSWSANETDTCYLKVTTRGTDVRCNNPLQQYTPIYQEEDSRFPYWIVLISSLLRSSMRMFMLMWRTITPDLYTSAVINHFKIVCRSHCNFDPLTGNYWIKITMGDTS